MKINLLPVSIYTLSDPRDNQIHYVGASVHPYARLSRHIKSPLYGNENSKLITWLRSLREEGIKPELNIIKSVDYRIAPTADMEYIQYFLNQGYKLENTYTRLRSKVVHRMPPSRKRHEA